MSTPEKLIARGYDTITAPAKKRCRVNSIPLSAIPVWRPEPSNIWTKVTKEYRSSSRECAAPYARAGSKRRHPDHPTCPCKRPLLDFSKMCETSYHKVNDKRDSIIIPKGVGLDIVSLCEEPDAFSIRPILECDNSSLYLVNKTSPSLINIDLDSMERDQTNRRSPSAPLTSGHRIDEVRSCAHDSPDLPHAPSQGASVERVCRCSRPCIRPNQENSLPKKEPSVKFPLGPMLFSLLVYVKLQVLGRDIFLWWGLLAQPCKFARQRRIYQIQQSEFWSAPHIIFPRCTFFPTLPPFFSLAEFPPPQRCPQPPHDMACLLVDIMCNYYPVPKLGACF